MDVDMKKYAGPASFGAMAVAVSLVALYAFMVWVSMPAPHGGIDQVHAVIAYIGIAGPLGAIAAAHVVFYRQLRDYAREHRDT
ncbi:MAG: hypothetical protein ABIZ91_02415 [Gemmatimonadaceae bacterium]